MSDAGELYQVGDVLTGSWGYEQTNVEFCEVVRVSGGMLELRPLKQQKAPGSDAAADAMNLSERVLPATGPERFKSERTLRRKSGAQVRFNDHCWLRKHDGEPRYQSHYG